MAATPSYSVDSPQWILSYSGVNITNDVSQMVLGIRYVDQLDGASGELEVESKTPRSDGKDPGIRLLAT